MKLKTFLVICITLVALACRKQTTLPSDPVAESQKFSPPDKTPKPQGTALELGLAGSAKVFCSALFVSGRRPEEAIVHSMTIFLPKEAHSSVKYIIDQTKKSVALIYNDTLRRSATYSGDCGCIIDTPQGIAFTPPVILTTLPEASTQAWPMGDAPEKTSPRLPLHSDSLNKAIETAFAPDSYTAAFLVIHNGKIIAERYDNEANANMQLESWSMGKSITALLIGRMIQQGYFKLDDPAPVPAWQQEGDPRKEIRIRDLLQMSSGLHFLAHRDPEASTYTQYLDHWYIYTGAVDAFTYSYSRPLQYPVGSTGRYRNCDPLTAGFIIRRTCEENGLPYHTYPQRELFDKIGIRKQVLETDPYGNFLLSGYDYGTARNWGRLGLLCLQDGVWNGERLLPEGFIDFVSSPAPGWEKPEYGGFFWINIDTFPIKEKAYYAAGAGGQYTVIIPDKNLVVVRMGHFNGSAIGTRALGQALASLVNNIN
ncbi:MAG: serine hydrolase [Flammeovirgaceae bacterium]|nr:MAG: serine hydrolase [Flammeovirgaceae bacterium]